MPLKFKTLFTGIIENTAKVVSIVAHESNLSFALTCSFVNELKIDQSVAHNGVCLTVTHIDIENNNYTVTAIKETIDRSNLGSLKLNDKVNVERCMKMDALLDGHIVQGHVDITAICTQIDDNNGSWKYYFSYTNPSKQGYLTVEKGSVTVNGVSLTVVDSGSNFFSVAIIPFTYEHTNFNSLCVGDHVNIEFDIIGKYVAKLLLNSNRL